MVRWVAKKNITTVRGDYAASVSDLIKAARSFAGWDFYIAPNPTLKKTGTRHTAADVTHWSWLFIDLDPITPSPNYRHAMSAIITKLTHMTQTEINPLTLDSGRGYQAWIRLDDVCCDIASVDCRHTQQVTMRWVLGQLKDNLEQYGCKLDTIVSDLPRIMRCPGTVNTKTGRVSTLVTTGRQHPLLGYKLMALVPEEEFHLAERSTVAFGGREWQFAFPHLTETAKDFILFGKQEPGRHSMLWHTAKKLHELGVSGSELRKAIQYGNMDCRPYPLPDKDVEHAIKTACRD